MFPVKYERGFVSQKAAFFMVPLCSSDMMQFITVTGGDKSPAGV
jgi:hypothetical protein